MARDIIITLNNISIEKWTVDILKMNVTVYYAVKINTGETYEYGEAIFWATLPTSGGIDPSGQPLPVPSNWYQLPVEYITALTDLTVDARTALLHLVNE